MIPYQYYLRRRLMMNNNNLIIKVKTPSSYDNPPYGSTVSLLKVVCNGEELNLTITKNTTKTFIFNKNLLTSPSCQITWYKQRYNTSTGQTTTISSYSNEMYIEVNGTKVATSNGSSTTYTLTNISQYSNIFIDMSEVSTTTSTSYKLFHGKLSITTD